VSCYCEGDPCDVWKETRRKARKQHTCCECRDTIEPGDEYVHISSCFDGSWSNNKLCEFCDHDWAYLRKQGHCQVIGELEASWKEAWEETPKLELSPTNVMYGAGWEERGHGRTHNQDTGGTG